MANNKQLPKLDDFLKSQAIFNNTIHQQPPDDIREFFRTLSLAAVESDRVHNNESCDLYTFFDWLNNLEELVLKINEKVYPYVEHCADLYIREGIEHAN
jgi:hypothetical protein